MTSEWNHFEFWVTSLILDNLYDSIGKSTRVPFGEEKLG